MTKAALAAVLLWQVSIQMPQASSTWAGGTITSSAVPNNTDTLALGSTAATFRSLYLSRLVQGSSSRALSEGAATPLFDLAVAQTAGSNFADAVVDWAVYATDGTDSQARRGQMYIAAVNKAGTETCGVGDIGTTVVAASAGTLTCTASCTVGLTDTVEPALNCTSSLTQTTLNVYWRVNGMTIRTVTPAGE